jgi:lipopolysaccharide/colanic/teichoic acid biosynthesis glycosyltransferase
MSKSSLAVKRIFDVTLVLLSLPLTLPLIGFVALLVRFKLGTPVLFVQPRPGYQGRIFHLVKFRTMREAFGVDGKPLPDGQRLTRLGRLLRSTSLDELPELWNMLRGEMSLVGPRPLLVAYLPRYTAEQMRRHDVLPGITGWAQIHGRNTLTWEDKFRLDVWYVDHRSLWLDVKILLLTIVKVLKREGVEHPGQATMTEFMGSSETSGVDGGTDGK